MELFRLSARVDVARWRGREWRVTREPVTRGADAAPRCTRFVVERITQASADPGPDRAHLDELGSFLVEDGALAGPVSLRVTSHLARARSLDAVREELVRFAEAYAAARRARDGAPPK